MKNKNLTRKNNLLEFRRRSGLEPKQIAVLLDKKSPDEIHLYESGNRYPNVPTLLRLAIVLATPPHFLYQDLYQELKNEIAAKRKKHPQLFPERAWFPANSESLKQDETCFYAEILKTRIPTDLELETVRKHILDLMNTVGNYKQGRNPFSL